MFSTLGNIKFTALKGFGSFQGKRSASLAEHALIDGKPRLQKIGDKLEEISLVVNFHTSFCDPEQELDALHSAMSAGEILPLVWGNGLVAGYFVIADVDRNIEKTTADGTVVKMGVTISLKEQSNPVNISSLQQSAVARGFAFDEVKPLPLRSLPQPGGVDLQVMEQIDLASLANEDIKRNLTRLERGTSAAVEVGQRIGKAALKIQQAMNMVQSLVQNSEQLITQASSLPLRAQELAAAAFTVQQQMPLTNLTSLSTAAGAVNSGLGNVKASAAPVATLSAIRRVIN